MVDLPVVGGGPNYQFTTSSGFVSGETAYAICQIEASNCIYGEFLKV